MTFGRRKNRITGGRVLAIALVAAGSAGCVGLVEPDSNLLATLGLNSSGLTDDGGNVVISYANGTKQPVQWRLVWQQAGSEEPSTLGVTIQPGETKTLTVQGTVERIAVGSLDGWSVAAVIGPSSDDPHTVTYGGGPLENGVDFRSGDIVRYGISPSGKGKYLISAEISRGG